MSFDPILNDTKEKHSQKFVHSSFCVFNPLPPSLSLNVPNERTTDSPTEEYPSSVRHRTQHPGKATGEITDEIQVRIQILGLLNQKSRFHLQPP